MQIAREVPRLERETFVGVNIFFWQENRAKIFGFGVFISSKPKLARAPRSADPTQYR